MLRAQSPTLASLEDLLYTDEGRQRLVRGVRFIAERLWRIAHCGESGKGFLCDLPYQILPMEILHRTTGSLFVHEHFGFVDEDGELAFISPIFLSELYADIEFLVNRCKLRIETAGERNITIYFDDTCFPEDIFTLSDLLVELANSPENILDRFIRSWLALVMAFVEYGRKPGYVGLDEEEYWRILSRIHDEFSRLYLDTYDEPVYLRDRDLELVDKYKVIIETLDKIYHVLIDSSKRMDKEKYDHNPKPGTIYLKRIYYDEWYKKHKLIVKVLNEKKDNAFFIVADREFNVDFEIPHVSLDKFAEWLIEIYDFIRSEESEETGPQPDATG